MIRRLEYGGVVFEHNPQSSTTSLDAMGDKIITLSGRRIYQPTGFLRRQKFSGVIYQPQTKTKNIHRIIETKVDFDNNERQIYLCQEDTQSINRYNHNLKLIDSLTFTKNTDETVVDITSLGDYFWVCVTNGSSERLLKILKTDNTNQTNYSVGITSDIQGMTNDDTNIYLISGAGELVKVTPSDGSQTLLVDMTNRSYVGLTYDGKYFWAGEYSFSDSTVYQFTSQGQVINSLLDYIQKEQNSQYENISSMAFDRDKKEMYIILNDESNTKLLICNPNTVLAEVYTLEQELKKGKVYMIDQNAQKRLVHINDFNNEFIDGALAVSISLNVNVED